MASMVDGDYGRMHWGQFAAVALQRRAWRRRGSDGGGMRLPESLPTRYRSGKCWSHIEAQRPCVARGWWAGGIREDREEEGGTSPPQPGWGLHHTSTRKWQRGRARMQVGSFVVPLPPGALTDSCIQLHTYKAHRHLPSAATG